jgi:transcriptional regulator with XRE-family HTH domain
MDEVLLLTKFGSCVKRARLSVKLSQEKLALGSGLDRTYISSVECGKRNVSLINIHKLASALGVRASDLLIDIGGGK